jgi:hypothetical protein
VVVQRDNGDADGTAEYGGRNARGMGERLASPRGPRRASPRLRRARLDNEDGGGGERDEP